MSRELLMSLQGAQAFDPAPRQNELHLYHVPFDELTAGDDAEASLLRAIRSSERAAVVGRGGQGKSSLIAHATRARVGIAPFRVPIFVEPDKTVTDPKAFAQHLIRTLTTSATQSGLISPEQREAALRASSDRVHILGEEVAHTRSAAEVIAAAVDLVAAVARQDVIPVAVHDDYSSMPEFQEAESFLETRIAIPAFEAHAERALGLILERRMAVQGVKVELSDVFHEGALKALADFYREADYNLRKVIWVAR